MYEVFASLQGSSSSLGALELETALAVPVIGDCVPCHVELGLAVSRYGS